MINITVNLNDKLRKRRKQRKNKQENRLKAIQFYLFYWICHW